MSLIQLRWLQKIFRQPQPGQYRILDKETVDEIIFRTMIIQSNPAPLTRGLDKI